MKQFKQFINEDMIPEEYKNEILTIKINNAQLKRDILSGKEIEGAIIQENTNINFR